MLFCRPRVRYELHGFTYLMEVLDLTLRACDETSRPLSDQEVDLCSEILKILFNLTVALEKKSADEVQLLLSVSVSVCVCVCVFLCLSVCVFVCG